MPNFYSPLPAHFEAIFHEAAIGIVVTNSNFEMILSNEYAQRLFGYTEAELFGQNISILIPNHLKFQHKEHVSKINQNPIKRPMGLGLELKAKRKDESLFPIEISLSHFKSEDKIYYIVFVSDVTLKQKVEMELILRNQEINQLNESLEAEVEVRTHTLQNTFDTLELQAKVLEESLQKEILLGDMKTRFVSMASHEFRTPLTSILSSASIIEKYNKPEDEAKRNQHIQRIKSSVAHLTEILEEFLFAGKLEAGKVEVRPETFHVAEFLIDLITELDGTRRPNQKIVLNMAASLNDFVSDTSMLRKVLLNGLSNALKFSKKDVFLNVSMDEEELVFEIIDQGIGISDADQTHLFERFFRGGNTHVIPGTGLGLYVMDRYMRLLCGELKLSSTLGVGTTLFIKLPPIAYAN